ncbi:LOW QUALITY PROTEIN: dual specificity mitogen-activated protein kinase kinase 3-like [Vipera latastei]
MKTTVVTNSLTIRESDGIAKLFLAVCAGVRDEACAIIYDACSLEKCKVGTKKKRPPFLRLPLINKQLSVPPTSPRNLDSRTFSTTGKKNFEAEADDLVSISKLGTGAVVEKEHHMKSNMIMAVKMIRATVNTQEQKGLLVDLDVSMRTVECCYIVTFYGALFRNDVWIGMDLMDISLDKIHKKVLEKKKTIPEDILGKIAMSIVRALEHLHSKLSVIHGDVKPSNILINKSEFRVTKKEKEKELLILQAIISVVITGGDTVAQQLKDAAFVCQRWSALWRTDIPDYQFSSQNGYYSMFCEGKASNTIQARGMFSGFFPNLACAHFLMPC